ncbi:hypothetical protein JCM21900_003024 [Sporobolomyces salmonicolor]
MSSYPWDGVVTPVLARVGAAHAWLGSTTPHPSIPFSIFAISHATRVACAYRGVARAGGYDKQLGNLQAAIVPLVLVLGGSTISSVLLGNVPGWVISPIPVVTYGLLPLLATKSGLVSIVLSLPYLVRETLFCLIDGFSRIMGMTTLGVDMVLAHSNPAVRTSPWAMVLIAFISGGGGGMLVPLFKMFGPEWGFTATPGFVKEGLPIDVWSAAFIGYVYATLIGLPYFAQFPAFINMHFPAVREFFYGPKGSLTPPASAAILPSSEAKIFCSILLASMLFFTRIIRPALARPSTPLTRKVAAKKTLSNNQKANGAAPSSKKSLKEKKTQ